MAATYDVDLRTRLFARIDNVADLRYQEQVDAMMRTKDAKTLALLRALQADLFSIQRRP